MRTAIGALSAALLGLLVYYGAAVAGPDIKNKVEGKAKAAAAEIAPEVEVKLEALDAVVSGVVATEDLRDSVIKAIKRVEGVRKVSDRLAVRGGGPDVALKPADPAPVDAKPPEPEGAVIAADVVDGDTDMLADDGQADLVEDATDDDAGGDGGEGPDDVAEADVEPEPEPEIVLPAQPTVEAGWDGSKLTLAGALPPALLGQLDTLILREFAAEDVVGEFIPTALKAAPGFDKAARSLLRMLAKSDSGKIRLEAGAATATLVMKDEATRKLVINTFAPGVAPAFKRTFDITTKPKPEPVPERVSERVPERVVEPPKVDPKAEPEPAKPVVAAVNDPGGALTAVQCQGLINALLDGPEKRITFTKLGSSRLSEAGIAKARQIAALLKRCPDAKGAIEGFHHNQGDPDEIRMLTHKRAFSLHQALVAEGIDKKRFTYKGLGYNFPKHPNTLATREFNERVEINLGVD